MALSDGLVSKTFMNLELFLQKAAALDIFEALIFNYKVKIGLLDPLAIHFLAIVTELANQLQLLSQETTVQTLQISELDVKKTEPQESMVLSIKSEEITIEEDPLVFSLYNSSSSLAEVHFSSNKSPNVPPQKNVKNITHTKLKPKPCKRRDNKSEKKYSYRAILPAGPKDERNFKCASCDSTFTTETKLLLHLSKCHKRQQSAAKTKTKNARVHKCSSCESVFTSRRLLTAHLKNTHKSGAEDPSDVSCTVSEDSVTELNEDTHNLPFFCCKTCVVVYKTYKEFEDHVCKNATNNMSEGTILHNYIQMTGRQLITNLEKLKALKKYKCGVCHEEYRSIPRMTYHLPRCTQGPYKCELCDEEYMFKKDLNLHKKKEHKGANSFFCDECGLTFKFRTSLQKHKVNRHETEQGPYTCEVCDKNFAKRVQLTNHKINTHRIERKFLCQVCGNKFSNHGSLMAHLDMHTEMRRFTCSYCNKKFRQKEKLKYHTRIHTGERPHLCQTCGKGFIRKSKLDEHMRRHRGEKRYHCNICNKSYAAAWDLKMHNKKQHRHLEATTDVKPTKLLSSAVKSESDADDPEPITSNGIKTEVKQSSNEKSKHVLRINGSTDQQNNQVLNVDSDTSGLLVQLNSENVPVVQDNSNSRILLQMPQQALLLNSRNSSGNSGSNNNSNNNNSSSNSKIIVQLDTTQQDSTQTNSSAETNSSRVVMQSQGASGNANSSRILLQLDPSQAQSLPPNTVLAVTDAIQLAPLVEDMGNINLGNVTTQYIQLTTAQADEAVSSSSAVANGNNVPLHIQLPVQLPLSALSQSTSGSATYELQSLSVQGQAGLVFTSGFDVGSITY